MILIWLILLPLLGGLLSWLVSRWSNLAARWVALLAVTLTLSPHHCALGRAIGTLRSAGAAAHGCWS